MNFTLGFRRPIL